MKKAQTDSTLLNWIIMLLIIVLAAAIVMIIRGGIKKVSF